MSAISGVRKKRGTTRGSITRLINRLEELEGKADQPMTFDLAQDMAKKLENLDKEFREYHYRLIDLIDEKEEEALRTEQDILDRHDDELADVNVRIKQLITVSSSSANSGHRKTISRRLSRLRKSIISAHDDVKLLTSSVDVCLVHHHKECLRTFKTELKDVANDLIIMDLEDSDDLYTSHDQLEEIVLECVLAIKKLLSSLSLPVDSSVDNQGVKLPKLDAPTFDGKLISWKSFWDQFDIAIHSRTTLSKAEKLAYLRNSLKNGSAKGVIEGLSESGEFYEEAIKSLKARYDRPRLIHRSHVRMIIEAPGLKDGTGREIRRLHDTVQQHLRALKAMAYEPSGPFITSILELKLDSTTSFEWQRFSQDTTGVPHYNKLLEFLNLRAQASEALPTDPKRGLARVNEFAKKSGNKQVSLFAANADEPPSLPSHCPVCKTEKHHLFACDKFKTFSHDRKMSIVKSNNLCINCLRPGHFLKQCKSAYHCRRCQKLHHTLMHIDHTESNPVSQERPSENISACVTSGMVPGSLLMTCRLLVWGPNGSKIESCALLDSASSASFISERLAQSLHLPRSRRDVRIIGVADLSHNSPTQAFTHFVISPLQEPSKTIGVTAVVVPRVTCDLPLQPVPFNTEWSHLTNLNLADPDFGQPGRIDILLGVDVFAEVVRQGRRMGLPGSPSAFETDFGWVLAGETNISISHLAITSYHTTVKSGDDLLRMFWEIEEESANHANLSPEECAVVQHFKYHHTRTKTGRFIVPLPRKPHSKPLGESRCQAVRRFKSLERSLCSRGLLDEFNIVVEEYFQEHAEPVPLADMEKPTSEVFYLPIHIVCKNSNSTTKVRAVFDASAHSTSGVSLNEKLLVGPTVHSSLVNVLLRFRLHRIALTTDISRMYRAVLLDEDDKDLHRFVWRRRSTEPLCDYRHDSNNFWCISFILCCQHGSEAKCN